MGFVVVAGALLLGVSSPAAAQSALAATGVDPREVTAGALLTLRPVDELRPLAERIAGMLELRTGQRVAVGEAPPPDLLEAVPAGHVAIAQEGDRVLLVLGAPGGRSFDTEVRVRDGGSPSDVRALAMGVEALRDEAVGMAHATARQADEEARAAAQQLPPLRRSLRPGTRDDRVGGEGPEGAGQGTSAELLAFLRLYAGASSASIGVMGGLGAGLGVCVERQCLFVAGDVPFTDGSAEDVRYRYTSFTSGVYLRPWRFGAVTPGASLMFLTRFGHFEQDMGLADSGLRSDLAARGALETAFELASGVDLMAETGLDFTIDGHILSSGDVLVSRGDRWAPWAQAAVRYRP